jgi:uncharacterized protein YqeY
MKMTLINTIKEKTLAARKARNMAQAGLFQTLYGDISIIGKNDGNRETTDAEALTVVIKFIKGLNEMLLYPNSDERKEALYNELEWLSELMPEMLTTARLRSMIQGMAVTGMTKAQIMKYLKEHHTGQYDGKEAAKLVSEVLAT